MKKLLLLLVVLPMMTVAQSHRFYYNVSFTKKPDKPDQVSRDLVVLDVQPKETYFFSNDYLRIDSLNQTTSNKQFAYPKYEGVVHGTNSGNTYEHINSFGIEYYAFESQPALVWNLDKGTKKLGGIPVQKATVDYGGRQWTAWFAPSIELSYGPDVFHGLPGMILEVYDQDDHYHFTFVGSKKVDEKIDLGKLLQPYLGVERVDVKQKDWIKVLENQYANPISEYKEGTAMMLHDDGTPYTANEYRDFEKAIQAKIKAENNPLNLDWKPTYH